MGVNKIKFLVRVWMFTLKHFQTRQVNLFGLYSYRFKSLRSLLNWNLLLCSWIAQINSHEPSVTLNRTRTNFPKLTQSLVNGQSVCKQFLPPTISWIRRMGFGMFKSQRPNPIQFTNQQSPVSCERTSMMPNSSSNEPSVKLFQTSLVNFCMFVGRLGLEIQSSIWAPCLLFIVRLSVQKIQQRWGDFVSFVFQV